MSNTTDATFAREITPEYETVGKRRRLVGFAMYLDGECIGLAGSYHEAEVTLDELVYNLLSDGMHQTAATLDGGSDPDACAAEVVDMLVIRGDEPVQQAAVLAHREAAQQVREPAAGGYYFCMVEDCTEPPTHMHGDNPLCCTHYAEYSGESCGCTPVAIDATALLEEADTVIGRLYCPFCMGNHLLRDCPLKRGDHITEADALLSQTANHPGPNCYCPDCMRAASRLPVAAYITRLAVDAGLICQFRGETHDSACPQKRPLLAPRVCGNCGGQHSIQQCSDIRRLLFAA